MRILLWALAVFLLLVFQSAVLKPLGIAPVNLVLILLVLALLLDSPYTAGLIALSGGIILDFLSGTGDGLFTLSLLLVLSIMYFMFEAFLNRELNNWIVAASIAAATWIFAACLILSNWIFNWFNQGQVLNWPSFVWEYLVLSLIFNLALTYPVWKYLSWVERLLDKLTHKK